MLGERLAELRKLNDDTQQTLADKLGISVWSIRAWEQGKSYPFSNVLLAICKLYGTSAVNTPMINTTINNSIKVNPFFILSSHGPAPAFIL